MANETRPEGTAGGAGAAPRSTEEARRAIEETRGRISSDLDAIETRLVEKKVELRDRLDVLRPARQRVRANPLPALGAALGVGLVLGLLSGGDGEGERERRRLDEEEREELRHWRRERRARLLHRLQRNDLERKAREEAREEAGPRERKERGPTEDLSLGGMAQTLSGTLAAAVAAGLRDRLQRMLLESHTESAPEERVH